jgi:predicted Rossmann-fold nucleotide-binding protein
MVTWTQLGVHDKPLALLDVAGSWTPLGPLLDAMVANGFLRPGGRALLQFSAEPVAAIDAVVT